jgi:tetratricopeptide (TPR) repeat protein
VGGRILLRCHTASELIQKGQYETAAESLGELWPGTGQRPATEGMPPASEAEVLLQCGTLTGWLGSVRNVPGAQEQAQDLLSEAQRKFESEGMPTKASEAQYEMGMCYWRLGQYGEARVVLQAALNPLTDADFELKAKVLIRRSIIEIWENRYFEAMSALKEAESVFASVSDAVKGRWHGQMALVLDKLATAEGNADRFDSAIMAYTAAIFHYELARHERHCATNHNNLAFLLYKLRRYADAHEQLDRAQLIFTRLKDPGHLSQVDETRARVLVAEGRYREADRIMAGVVKALGQGGESALLADALTVRGLVWARLGMHESSVDILRQAMKVAQEAGAYTQAGLAALTLIEEHAAEGRLAGTELAQVYGRADELLRNTQDADDIARLRACSQTVVKRLAGAQLLDKNFNFYGAVLDLEANFIEQALELEAGSLSRAARRLGLKHQSLSHMLKARHKSLIDKRTPPSRRRRSIIKKKGC